MRVDDHEKFSPTSCVRVWKTKVNINSGYQNFFKKIVKNYRITFVGNQKKIENKGGFEFFNPEKSNYNVAACPRAINNFS